MNTATLATDIETKIKWAALHRAGYRNTPDLPFLINALTDPEPAIWGYAQRVLRRILPMAALVERWPYTDERNRKIASELPSWIHVRCANWGPDHDFVVICSERLAAAERASEQLLMQRLATFFGAARLISERLSTSGHYHVAARFQKFRRAFMDDQFPRQLTIMPTMACQLKCQYCYSAGMPPTRSNTMTQKELVRLLEWAHQSGVTRICLAGGEPTLYPHLDTFLDFLAAHQMTYFLSTNGLFGRKVLDLILSSHPLSVSLHINPENYHTPKKTQFVTNAQAFAKSGIMTALRFNLISAGGIEEYVEYLDLCEEIGVRQIRLAVPVPNFCRTNTFVTIDTDLKSFARCIDQFVSTSRQRGIEVFLSKPFPLCLLAEATAEIFLDNGSYNACCQVHLQGNTQNMTVYPDMHFSPCLSLNRPSAKPIHTHPDIFQAAASFNGELDELSQMPMMNQCRDCPLSDGGRCIGACFSYRVGSDTTVDSGNKRMR